MKRGQVACCLSLRKCVCGNDGSPGTRQDTSTERPDMLHKGNMTVADRHRPSYSKRICRAAPKSTQAHRSDPTRILTEPSSSSTYQPQDQRQHREHDRAASRPAGGRRKDRLGSLPDGDYRTPQAVAAGPQDEMAQQDGCSVQGISVPRPHQPIAVRLKVSRSRCAVERL